MTRLVLLLALLVFSAQSYEETGETADEYVQTSTIRIPTVYESMGTPLYKALGVFEKYAYIDGMEALIRHYGVFMTPIFRHGLQLSCKEMIEGSERRAYLKELRALEEEKKRIMFHLMNMAVKAVEEDDYETFAHLVALPLEELFTITSKRHIAVVYYKAKRQRPIPAMDALAAKMEKERKSRTKKKRHQVADDGSGPRDYELKQHLPYAKSKAGQSGDADDAKAENAAYCDNTDPSMLKKIGNAFKSMGIDFDPSLLEEYKGHKSPSAEDIK